MNGATADPFTRTIRPPKMNSTRKIGTSQYFLRAIRNWTSSLRNDIAIPFVVIASELVGHRAGLGAGRIAHDPVARQVGAPAQRQHVLAEQPQDEADRRDAEEEHGADDQRAD